MTTPSTIAATSLALRHFLQSSLPSSVVVTTLPPCEAIRFVPSSRRPARVNVALLSIQESLQARLTQRVRPGDVPGQPAPLAVEADYLLTAHAKANTANLTSPERLLEAVLVLLAQHPLLTPTELQKALPDCVTSEPVRLSWVAQSEAELAEVCESCRIPRQPALRYRASLILSPWP